MAQKTETLIEGHLYNLLPRQGVMLAYVTMILEPEGQAQRYIFAVREEDLVPSNDHMYVLRERAQIVVTPFCVPDVNMAVAGVNPTVAISQRFKEKLEAFTDAEPVAATFRA